MQPIVPRRIAVPMPRYFFHIFNDEIVLDEEGLELPDIDSARQNAIAGARSLICRSVENGHLNLNHRIEVCDESDSRLFTMTFREAFTLVG